MAVAHSLHRVGGEGNLGFRPMSRFVGYALYSMDTYTYRGGNRALFRKLEGGDWRVGLSPLGCDILDFYFSYWPHTPERAETVHFCERWGGVVLYMGVDIFAYGICRGGPCHL